MTDDWDRRTLTNLLDTFLCPAVLEDGYTFQTAAYGTLPNGSMHKDYLAVIGELPINDDPAVRARLRGCVPACLHARSHHCLSLPSSAYLPDSVTA